MRFLPVVLATCLFASQAIAQTYEPGWVVRSGGDTLRGEVENAFWNEPPTYIRYRAGAGSASQLFQPRQLRAVQVGGRYFRLEALPIDYAASTNLSKVQKYTGPEVRTDSLLCEVLLDGPLTLWRVALPASTHFLLRRPGQPVLDLAERKQLRRDPSGATVLAEGNNYRSQLVLYFGDCPAAAQAAEVAPFTAAGLGAVAQAYYATCAPEPMPAQSWLKQAGQRSPLALQGGLTAGLRYTDTESGTDLIPETQSCADCRPQPYAGLYADAFSAGRRLAVFGELTVGSYRSRVFGASGYGGTSPLPATQYFVVTYKGLLASARLGLRYFFPLPHEQQWFIGASYELHKSFRPVVLANTGVPVTLPAEDYYFSRPSLLPALGVGWRSAHLTVGLDAQLYPGDDVAAFIKSFGTKFSARLGLSYRLGRLREGAMPVRPTPEQP